MIPLRIDSYLPEFFVLILLLQIIFWTYLFLRGKIKFLRPFSAIIISIIAVFLLNYFLNEALGIYLRSLPLLLTGGYIVMVIFYELVISRVKKFKLVLITISFLIVGLVIYLFANELFGNYIKYFPDQPNYPTNCVRDIGIPCAVIEDKGKVTASKTEEAMYLIKKYGRENVTFQALEIHLAHDDNFIQSLNPKFSHDTGCIILVRAGNEGFVMQEEKNLQVIHTETLEEFKSNTYHSDPKILEQFYNELN